MVHNCAQTIMEVYADDLGINKELANHLGCNFGGGMKCRASVVLLPVV